MCTTSMNNHTSKKCPPQKKSTNNQSLSHLNYYSGTQVNHFFQWPKDQQLCGRLTFMAEINSQNLSIINVMRKKQAITNTKLNQFEARAMHPS